LPLAAVSALGGISRWCCALSKWQWRPTLAGSRSPPRSCRWSPSPHRATTCR